MGCCNSLTGLSVQYYVTHCSVQETEKGYLYFCIVSASGLGETEVTQTRTEKERDRVRNILLLSSLSPCSRGRKSFVSMWKIFQIFLCQE